MKVYCMMYKFKYCSFREKMVEGISFVNSFIYYCFWFCGIIMFFCKVFINNIKLNINEADLYFAIWLYGFILSILVSVICAFTTKGVCIIDDKIIISLNHPTFYSIKIKHTFQISDIKNIEYISSTDNQLSNLINQVPNRSKLEYISKYNDYIFVELNNGEKYAFSIEDNIDFFNRITHKIEGQSGDGSSWCI